MVPYSIWACDRCWSRPLTLSSQVARDIVKTPALCHYCVRYTFYRGAAEHHRRLASLYTKLYWRLGDIWYTLVWTICPRNFEQPGVESCKPATSWPLHYHNIYKPCMHELISISLLYMCVISHSFCTTECQISTSRHRCWQILSISLYYSSNGIVLVNVSLSDAGYLFNVFSLCKWI